MTTAPGPICAAPPPPPGTTAMGAPAAAPATLEHALVAARARVLANPGVDSLRQWIAEPQSSGWASQPLPHRAAALYVAALGSSQLRDSAGARAAAKKLDDPVSRHGSDVVGCAQPSERSARRIAQPIPSVLASDATPRSASMECADRHMN